MLEVECHNLRCELHMFWKIFLEFINDFDSLQVIRNSFPNFYTMKWYKPSFRFSVYGR